MAQRKKKPQKKPSRLAYIKEPRNRRILGLFIILTGVFVLVSYLSYLFTWRTDQDVVSTLSPSFLWSDVQVDNHLGRLGAYVSNAIFYWGFGLMSIGVAFILMDLGRQLLGKAAWWRWFTRSTNTIIMMAGGSAILSFLFVGSELALGGAFGDAICGTLRRFIGQVGLLLLLLTLTAAYLLWLLDFDTSKISFARAKQYLDPKAAFISVRKQFKQVFKEFKEDPEIAPTTTGKQEAIPFDFEDESITVGQESAPRTISSEDGSAFAPKLGNMATEDQASQEDFLDQTQEEGVTLELQVNSHTSEQPPSPAVSDSSLRSHASTDDLEIEVVSPDEVISPPLDIQEEEDSLEPYDPSKDLSRFKQPELELLELHDPGDVQLDRSELQENKNQIISTLQNYKIEITKIRATIGPTVTLYEIVPAPGVRISKIKNLEDDIALSLAALGIRIIAPIPGKGTVGIEVPNKNKQIVSLREVLNSDKYQKTKMILPIALGKTISNEVFVADLSKMPHLLIAGATGQGKSVGINTVIMSLLYRKHPSELKFVLIDPKKVELFPYSKLLKHYLAVMPDQEEEIITDTKKVIYTLNSLCIEMDSRYDLLKKARSRNIKEYNAKFRDRKLNPADGHKYLPLIVLVIDEFADLIMTAGKEVEMPIGRLAQLARAIGIHLIIATQRPSVNIITGIIKANFPARVAFKVTSKIDSRTILDAGGAEQLIGRGDMLLSIGGDMVRLQCAFVDTPEVERVLDWIDGQQGYIQPYYLPAYDGGEGQLGDSQLTASDLDDMFNEAAYLVVSNQSGSTSMIQRKLKLGYNRAGRIMDQLEAMGIVGPSEGSKAREVYVTTEAELMERLEEMNG